MEMPYSDTNAGLHYDLALDLDPRAGSVTVRGSVAYHAPLPRLERARFYLHHQFEIQRVSGRRVLGYHFENMPSAGLPFSPQAGTLDVYFDPPLRMGETALIEFEYSGILSGWAPESANIITPDWAELGLYLPWFPFQFDGNLGGLTYTLKVTAPDEYHIASLGAPSYENGVWFFNWPHQTSDIVVAAGPALKLHSFTSPPNQIFLHAATFGDDAAARLGEDLLWTLERYSGWFGPTRPGDFTLIESPRPLGGGYARRGLVVLAGINERDYFEQREAYLRYLAHETAHAWWWEAPADSWEDWLNESFAEYSALLAVRERFGEETYLRFIERKRERAAGLDPLWGFARADVSSLEKQAVVERVLYDQGTLLLHDLAERIGQPRFLALCRARLWSGVERTEHLLDVLEEIEDAPARRWMEDRLRNGAL
jgi:hypothetical protein